MIVAFFALNIGISGSAISYTENKGIVGHVEEFSNRFQDDSIIVFSRLSYTGISFPLKYIFDKNAILLPEQPSETDDVVKFVEMCAMWLEEGRNVYLVNPTSDFINQLSPHLEVTYSFDYTFETTLLEYNYPDIQLLEIPKNVHQVVIPITTYELTLIQ